MHGSWTFRGYLLYATENQSVQAIVPSKVHKIAPLALYILRPSSRLERATEAGVKLAGQDRSGQAQGSRFLFLLCSGKRSLADEDCRAKVALCGYLASRCA